MICQLTKSFKLLSAKLLSLKMMKKLKANKSRVVKLEHKVRLSLHKISKLSLIIFRRQLKKK